MFPDIYISDPVTPPNLLLPHGIYPGLLSTSAVYSNATTVFGAPMWVPKTMTIDRVYFSVNVSSGNIDFGIYTGALASLTKVWTKGSTVCPATGAQLISLGAAAFSLAPGWYWSVFQADNTTLNISYAAVGGQFGAYSWTNTFPLGATLTTGSRAGTRLYAPIWIAQNGTGL